MKQFYITKENISQDSPDDCYLAPDDPIQELKILSGLGGLNAQGRLQEYQAHENAINNGSNITVTAMEKVNMMKANDIRPGTPEWFKLWFSRPYMTGEKPLGN